MFSKIDNVITSVIDATGLYNKQINNVKLYNNDFETTFKTIINEVNKEAQDKYTRVFVIMGLGVIKSKTSVVGAKLIDLLFSNIDKFKKSKIILVDDYIPFQNLEIESWYSKAIVDTNGIWLGGNPTSQNSINFSLITKEQEQEQMNNIAYTCGSNGVILFKYVTEDEQGDINERKQNIS